MRLNVGCGRDVRPGWVNMDITRQDGMGPGDIVGDVQEIMTWRCMEYPPLELESCFSVIEMSHVIEHLPDVLSAMENLHRIAAPDALLTVRCPHGASDDAWEDPTHVRTMFPSSFMAFGQPYYWRADYGYRGDWEVVGVELLVASALRGKPADEIHRMVTAGRNFVHEMRAELRCRKPIRPAQKELLRDLSITYVE